MSNHPLLQQLKNDAIAIASMGSPLLQCNGMFVPRGLEDYRFLIMSGPRPIATNADSAEANFAGGYTMVVPGFPQTKFTGTFQMLETEEGHIQYLSEYVVANGGKIDIDFYDGRVNSYTRAYEMFNCAIKFESAEYSSDAKSNVMTVSCPVDYNYFGQFAAVGTNGTVFPGQRDLPGVSGLINRVQGVINAAQVATNAARGIQQAANAIGSLFG